MARGLAGSLLGGGAEEPHQHEHHAVRGGEVIALLGPSGSGKSTLLRCINMLEVPDSGVVAIDGEEIKLRGTAPHRQIADENQIRRIRSELGMVFQSFELFPHRTVLDNIAYGLTVRGEPRQRRDGGDHEIRP